MDPEKGSIEIRSINAPGGAGRTAQTVITGHNMTRHLNPSFWEPRPERGLFCATVAVPFGTSTNRNRNPELLGGFCDPVARSVALSTGDDQTTVRSNFSRTFSIFGCAWKLQ